MKGYTFVDYATQGYLALVGILTLLFHNHTVPAWPWFVAAHAAGLVVNHGLIQAHRLRPQNRPLDFLRHFYPVLLYTAFFCETARLNRMFFTEFKDPWMIRADQALFGCQPGVILMFKFPWLAVSELLYASYFCYYVMIAGVGIALFLRNRSQFYHYLSVVSFIFYLCYLAYIILPVIGPQVFAGHDGGFILSDELHALAPREPYPEHLKVGPFSQLMAWIYRVFESPGAAFPSSHVAIALTTVYFSFRYLPRIRFVHLGVAILLCISTMYCHYHYGVDVIAGALTALLLIPLANKLYFRFEKTTS